MFGYRLSKYDSKKRDQDGVFLDEDWTSISDIGRTVCGAIFSEADYLRSENSYVQAIETLLSAAGINAMHVTDLETRPLERVHIYDGVIASCQEIQNDQIVSGRTLESLVRGCLREYTWCRMSGLHGSYIHFGYDYYVYIGLPKPAQMASLPGGIFLDEYTSPYMTVE